MVLIAISIYILILEHGSQLLGAGRKWREKAHFKRQYSVTCVYFYKYMCLFIYYLNIYVYISFFDLFLYNLSPIDLCTYLSMYLSIIYLCVQMFVSILNSLFSNLQNITVSDNMKNNTFLSFNIHLKGIELRKKKNELQRLNFRDKP